MCFRLIKICFSLIILKLRCGTLPYAHLGEVWAEAVSVVVRYASTTHGLLREIKMKRCSSFVIESMSLIRSCYTVENHAWKVRQMSGKAERYMVFRKRYMSEDEGGELKLRVRRGCVSKKNEIRKLVHVAAEWHFPRAIPTTPPVQSV